MWAMDIKMFCCLCHFNTSSLAVNTTLKRIAHASINTSVSVLEIFIAFNQSYVVAINFCLRHLSVHPYLKSHTLIFVSNLIFASCSLFLSSLDTYFYYWNRKDLLDNTSHSQSWISCIFQFRIAKFVLRVNSHVRSYFSYLGH